MQYVLISLCLFALTLCGCASRQEGPAAKQQSAPTQAQMPTDAASSDQPTAKAAPASPKAASAPTTPPSPVSGFPMSPADAVKLIEPKQAPYVSGGWGRSSDDAVVFRRGDAYYNYIMLEHFLIIARNRMFTTTEKGEEYVVLNDRLRFTRSPVEKNTRKYDHWQYTFIISKKTDIEKARKIVESSMKGEEKAKRLKEFAETFSQEFWFDVTDVFALRSEELFRGLGKKSR
jgi:hypothetical protein